MIPAIWLVPQIGRGRSPSLRLHLSPSSARRSREFALTPGTRGPRRPIPTSPVALGAGSSGVSLNPEGDVARQFGRPCCPGHARDVDPLAGVRYGFQMLGTLRDQFPSADPVHLAALGDIWSVEVSKIVDRMFRITDARGIKSLPARAIRCLLSSRVSCSLPNDFARSLTNTIGLPPPPSLRAASRISSARPHRPDARFPVDLAPHRPADLAATRRRQHQELEGQHVHLGRVRRPHPFDGRHHLPMGQGLPVFDDIVLGAEHRQQPVARVVGPVFHRHGQLKYRPESTVRP